MKLSSPAAERNRDAIADVLAPWLPPAGLILEVASGSGEHAVHFARRFPSHAWQPSDPDPQARASIAAWRDEATLPLLLPPLDLDASTDEWPIDHASALVCINMVHISPWAATLGLMRGAARVLRPGASLILYGPFHRKDVPTAPSNEAFDASLRMRDPQWGLRTVDDVASAAVGFVLVDLVEMPANNIMLLFRHDDVSAT